MSLRCERWAPSSNRISEFWPTTGSRIRAPSPGCSTSGGAVKTCFTSSGSDRWTKGGVETIRRVKRLP